MENVKYQTLAVQEAWRILTKSGIRIGQAVTDEVDEAYYHRIRNRFKTAKARGGGTMSASFLAPLFKAVPEFLDELERQQLALLDPTRTDLINDAFSQALAKAMADSAIMETIESMRKDLEALKKKVEKLQASK